MYIRICKIYLVLPKHIIVEGAGGERDARRLRYKGIQDLKPRLGLW